MVLPGGGHRAYSPRPQHVPTRYRSAYPAAVPRPVLSACGGSGHRHFTASAEARPDPHAGTHNNACDAVLRCGVGDSRARVAGGWLRVEGRGLRVEGRGLRVEG
eukprot:455059-Rhodomonas_salina.2